MSRTTLLILETKLKKLQKEEAPSGELTLYMRLIDVERRALALPYRFHAGGELEKILEEAEESPPSQNVSYVQPPQEEDDSEDDASTEPDTEYDSDEESVLGGTIEKRMVPAHDGTRTISLGSLIDHLVHLQATLGEKAPVYTTTEIGAIMNLTEASQWGNGVVLQ